MRQIFNLKSPTVSLGLGMFGVTLVLLATCALAYWPRMNVAAQPQSRSSSASRVFFVAPEGAPSNDGSREHPLDLATALSSKGPVRPGALVWLRGGTYRGIFRSELTGTKEAPITVRQYPGERATIDSAPSREAALYISGAWTIYWGFEVMNSDPLRVIRQAGASEIRRGIGLDVHASDTKLVNLVVHDTAVGLGIWSDAVNTEAHGNIIYHNGWDAADRTHGHGIYTQNQTGERLITDNIIFNQFSHGIHAYGSDQAHLNNIVLRGNVSFNNGALRERHFDRNILLGGGSTAMNPVVENNYSYYSDGLGAGGENNFGYSGGCANLIAKSNYLMGHSKGGKPMTLSRCAGTITGNTVYGPVDDALAAIYPDNTFLRDRPTGLRVFVRKNHYEPGRAHIVIYNWDRLREVTVDLSEAGLDKGERFQLRDAQDYFGTPVFEGTYTGQSVTVPMRGFRVAPVIGNAVTPPHTAPDFMALVLVSRSRGVTP